MGGVCSAHGETRNAHKILVEKPEEKTGVDRMIILEFVLDK
jgi:hypothetical protein